MASGTTLHVDVLRGENDHHRYKWQLSPSDLRNNLKLYTELSPPLKPLHWLSEKLLKGQGAPTCQAQKVFSNSHRRGRKLKQQPLVRESRMRDVPDCNGLCM